MASYTKCDMCGCVIAESFFSYSIQIRRNSKYTINDFECDLCKNCMKSVKDFIREERKANEHLDKELE